MSADIERLRHEALRIAKWHMEDAEFCLVYEDEECADMTEDEWRQIHSMVVGARVEVAP